MIARLRGGITGRRERDAAERYRPPAGWAPGQPVRPRPLLELQGLRTRLGERVVVDGVDLAVDRSTVHALIGPNDAGKTTLLNTVSGLVRPASGRVLLDGTDVTGLPPRRLARMGIGRTFQHTSLFWSLSPRENVQLATTAAEGVTDRWHGAMPGGLASASRRLLGRVGIGHLADADSAHAIAAGEQHALELGLALAVGPRLLLLDEPTAGLAPGETRAAVQLLRRLVREQALTVLIVEHDMDVVFGLADRITVLHHGSVLATGAPAEIRGHSAVREAYLGSTLDA